MPSSRRDIVAPNCSISQSFKSLYSHVLVCFCGVYRELPVFTVDLCLQHILRIGVCLSNQLYNKLFQLPHQAPHVQRLLMHINMAYTVLLGVLLDNLPNGRVQRERGFRDRDLVLHDDWLIIYAKTSSHSWSKKQMHIQLLTTRAPAMEVFQRE